MFKNFVIYLSFSSMLLEPLKLEIEALFIQYPLKLNALLPLLHLVQREYGFISNAAVEEVAKCCETTLNHVRGVVTFYTMYTQENRGKRHLAVCTNMSCWLKGGREILEYLEQKLGVHAGQSTLDGEFFLEEVECLGACGYAPILADNYRYREKITREKIDELLDFKNEPS